MSGPGVMKPHSRLGLAVALTCLWADPPALAEADRLEGYGASSYEPLCAYVCHTAVPSQVECPEFAAMTPEERAEAFPGPKCLAADESYLTSIAWCISKRCQNGTTMPSAIQEFWETKLIYGQDEPGVVLKFPTYFEALSRVNTTAGPPLPKSPDETVLNRTISVTDDEYLGYLNAALSYQDTALAGSHGMFLVMFSGIAVPIGLTAISLLPWPAKWASKFNAYFIDPPVFGRYHSVPVLKLAMIPTRGQAIFIIYIIFVNVLANCLGFHLRTPNAWFPDKSYEITRYIANRAGALSFANLPLVFLYGGRNNPLLWLTNWSYATYLLAHRWIATIVALQVALHSAMWLQIMVKQNSYGEALAEPYWRWGIVGTMAMCLFIPFSILPIRRRWYEIFLVGHIVLAILAIVGSYWHIVHLYKHQSGFDLFIYSTMGIWGFDRLLRMARVARNGLKRAYVTKVDDEYIRVDIPGVEGHGYCFAYFPTLSWRPWENHPFSIINYTRDQDDSSSSPGSSSGTESPPSPDTTHMQDAFEKSAVVRLKRPGHIATRNRLHGGISMFMRVQNGMTRRLARAAGNAAGIPVLVEGSYGHEGKTLLQGHDSKFAPTMKYPNTLCIAGGAGISAVMPALNHCLSLYGMKGSTKLYWGLRSKELVSAVESSIVGPGGDRADWGEIETHISVGSRLNVRRILEEELEQRGSAGTTVIVCGPLAMCDEVRYTVAALARHGKVLRLVEESLPW
ncbi:EVI5-like protein [Purpureocillium lavendulum]|uniref:EVI5-like protein n=1 Tax=Purpureocillium lavendulum TaxID=1247861 RepID=A0AB34FZF0_9HYPO|nr:EVI5-like protein [Purpureocillium lavendulum]